MLLVKFCWIEKTSRYVGWTLYNNGTYYASGDTLDALLKNMYVSLKYHHNVWEACQLDSKPSPQSEIPMRLMAKRFITMNITGKRGAKKKFVQTNIKLLDRETLENNLRKLPKYKEVLEVAKEEKPKYDYYDKEVANGELIVYGIKRIEVARFKLNPTKDSE